MGGRGGSSGLGSGTDQVFSFERTNYRNSSEHGLLLKLDGTVKRYDGSEHHITGSKEEIESMSGGIFTHNHPTNVTFSDTDIGNGIVRGNLKEMRAVTSSGEIHVLKSNGASLDDRKKFFAGFQQARMKASNVADSKIRRGESVDKNRYISTRVEKYMEENAGKYHMRYEKKRLKANRR